MIKKIIILAITFMLLATAVVFAIKTMNKARVSVDPVMHASAILNVDERVIYTDPVGADKFLGKPEPHIILITDIHGDHLDIEVLKIASKENTTIIAPMAVADMIPESVPGTLLVMNNGQKTEVEGVKIEAIPMYNLPEKDNADRHTKGRGNGYVIEKRGTRVYISGDTAGIPEMRSLKGIDMAFVAMNLPYTMGVEEAADAVLAFKPKKVYPYHYRTPEGFSDIAKFKQMVNNGDSGIEVVELKWY